MAKNINDELKRKIEQEVGPKFCDTLSRAQLSQMQKFIKDYEAGEIVEASVTLESLDFLMTVSQKMCVREEPKA